MGQVITNAFEQYWQSSLAAEQPVVLDEFVLADIPNLDITAPIDPDTGLPPAGQIVYRQTVDQRGRVNSNAVAYSIVMDTTVGDFSFNAMFLRNKANGVIGMIVYKGRETKLKTDQTTGQTGNSLVKSMLMGYDQAAEATLTHVDAGTWQIDYAARLRGQDEDLRQLASQLYGHHTFIGDGFKVVQQDSGHQVTPGVAIVGGLRVELKAPEVIYPGSKPIGVWVDVHRAGSLLSEHQNHFTIITSVADLADHVDGSGYQHFVAKIALISEDGSIKDTTGSNRVAGGIGGIEVTAESFGVISGLVSLPVARTNAYKIMNKAAELSAAGGGKIIFTKPLYQVHMDESDFSAASATVRVAALYIPYDNVILSGQGWTATTIQAYATNSAYGVIQWSKAPLENGITKVHGVGLHHICVDGNYHGDFTPASYVRQTEGVLGAGIEGLSINNLKVKNCSHYGMGLQNGGYKGCRIDGYWSENTGADGIDIKDNGSVSRAFQLNNIFVFNFGQLDEPEHPWAGVDIMSLAPEVSNVFVSDFGDKGQPGAVVRIKQGPIGDLASRGTGGAWANVSNITAIQNRFKASPSEVIGLHIKAPNVNYSNIVAYGAGGKIGYGVWLEERYCQGANVQIAHVVDGYVTTSATGPSDRAYGDADACSIVGLVIVDAARAAILNRKHQKLNNVTMKDCPVGFVAGGSNIGKVVVKGLHLDNVTDPFGQLGGAYHSIADVTGPNTANWQSGLAILKTASDFATTAVLSKNGVRLYSGSTDETVGTELARFTPTASNVYSSLVVAGNAQPNVANMYFVGTGPSPWAGGFTQTAFTVTSDENHKTKPLDITDTMLDAAAQVDWVQYQYLDRVEVKGEDGARWHFGAVAQRYVEAFHQHELDPFRFAFICYDEWEATPEVTELIPALLDENGDVIEPEQTVVVAPAVDAGSRYGIRYEEALALEAALQRRNYQRLLRRIEVLEAN
ncbi:phage tail protein [Aeromonas media]|uniref:phage tail-collar fiber domain-containing protein n=1 Tax=Aeromonas media TaxID=651 RepID=UPI003D00FADD